MHQTTYIRGIGLPWSTSLSLPQRLRRVPSGLKRIPRLAVAEKG